MPSLSGFSGCANVSLKCQPERSEVIVRFDLGRNGLVLCHWYFVPFVYATGINNRSANLPAQSAQSNRSVPGSIAVSVCLPHMCYRHTKRGPMFGRVEWGCVVTGYWASRYLMGSFLVTST